MYSIANNGVDRPFGRGMSQLLDLIFTTMQLRNDGALEERSEPQEFLFLLIAEFMCLQKGQFAYYARFHHSSDIYTDGEIKQQLKKHHCHSCEVPATKKRRVCD